MFTNRVRQAIAATLQGLPLSATVEEFTPPKIEFLCAPEDLGVIAAATSRPEPEQRTLEVPLSAQGQRLDAFLAACVPEYSRSHLKTLIDAGCVQVNGQPATSPSRKVLLPYEAQQLVSLTARRTLQGAA